MKMKQQSAVEFIMTYSWAIIAISLFVVVVIVLSDARPPQNYLQSTCSIQPLLPCTDSLLAYSSAGSLQYYMVFVNQLGTTVFFPGNSINVTLSIVGGRSVYSLGSCSPNLASEGAAVLCTAAISSNLKPGPGSSQIVDFALNYSTCLTSNAITCAKSYYKSSGYSLQDISPSGTGMDLVTFSANRGGTIVLNGVTYFSSTVTYLPSGNYVIFGQPAAGTSFNSIAWSVNSPSSVVTPSSQNTVLVLSSNTVLQMQFS